MKSDPGHREPDTPDGAFDAPLSSNAIRLSPRLWLVAIVLVGACWYFIPAAWQRLEPLPSGPDVRVPYSLSDDYWIVERFFREAALADKALLIGDSVIWGHYVDRDQTLSHYLNERTGIAHFANLGIDGIHPAALMGLIEHYGASVKGRVVVLNCNLLWISSPRHDLQIDKEFAFNHPALVPQFSPRIPCYRASVSRRLGHVIRRNVPTLSWARHLQIAYFGNSDIPYWTIEHPRESPTRAITFELPLPDEPPSPQPVALPWTERGIGRFSPAWVEFNTSIQWSCFRRTVEILQRRENRVFVVVGPFNEHMLDDESRSVYQARKREVKVWLDENRIPCYVPEPLDSELYADASHPLAKGYRTLAWDLLEDEAFQTFLSGREK